MANPIRTIQHDEPLDTIWGELVYTEARLLSKNNDVASFAKPIEKLIARSETVAAGQRAAWRAEIVAQAAVDDADDALDDDVDTLDRELQHLDRGRDSARYRRYFPKAASAIIRLGLESELKKVRGFVEALAGEAEKSLKKIGKAIEAAVSDGDAAIEGRVSAASARASHRARDIASLVDDVNAARLSLYGTLITTGQERKLAGDWAGRFFRRTQRAPKAVEATPPVSPTPPATPPPPAPAPSAPST